MISLKEHKEILCFLSIIFKANSIPTRAPFAMGIVCRFVVRVSILGMKADSIKQLNITSAACTDFPEKLLSNVRFP